MLQRLAYWLIPPGFQNVIRKFLSAPGLALDPTTVAVRRIVEKNSRFRNSHLGERCFILATGPSIKEQDLTVLKGELCIAVSHFFLHKDLDVVSPKYHVLAPYHPPFGFDDIRTVFAGMKKYYKNKPMVFCGHRPYEYSIYNFLQKHPEYKDENNFFLDYSLSSILDEENYNKEECWDICKKPFEIRSVIYSAIQVAFYMGCKEIYLLGCDHDYLNDTQRVSNHHFYREEDGTSDVANLSAFTTERWFGEYHTRWRDYRLINTYLTQKGCSIFNATKGGMLDVFPRVDFTEMFKVK